jgi:sulfatase maturation enzyme AslB (radical SAM superfamily)
MKSLCNLFLSAAIYKLKSAVRRTEVSATQQEQANETPSTFRLDVQIHDLLTKSPESKPVLLPDAERATLPEPVFPQRPELLTQDDDYEANLALARSGKRRWTAPLVFRAMNGWLFPYVKSRVLPGQFHPIISYLFTEWKCNLDCHYCWAFDNNVKGMTEEVARRSIDWLHSGTCRVLALMGGEPLLRPQFAHKVCYYAAKKGFWIYLPTNARLLRPELPIVWPTLVWLSSILPWTRWMRSPVCPKP